jgi:hypothetical protein
VAFIRKVKIQWGITIQIAYKVGVSDLKIIHIRSPHNKEELDILFAAGWQQLFANKQLEHCHKPIPCKLKQSGLSLLC